MEGQGGQDYLLGPYLVCVFSIDDQELCFVHFLTLLSVLCLLGGGVDKEICAQTPARHASFMPFFYFYVSLPQSCIGLVSRRNPFGVPDMRICPDATSGFAAA
jgi:hypothetical protein